MSALRYEQDTIEMRARYCDALVEAARENPRVVAMDVDTSASMGTAPFYAAYPERAINCGIMEANAVGVAAGLSSVGYVPFLHAFGAFASRRAYDQAFLSCAYQNLNVKIIGMDAGVTATVNGGTHMPLEDMGVMRCIPGMTVVEPADGAMLPYLVRHMAQTYGCFYLRFGRKKLMRVYGDGEDFTLGRAIKLRDGRDAAIVACGILVHESLVAAELLRQEGIEVAVLDMHTVKPVDADAIEAAARLCGAIVTAENHNVIGGLGSAVAEVLGERRPVPLERVGVKESFGEIGTQDYLMKKFGLTAGDIAQAVKRAVRRRN
ncbi:MAG TPA: transketolase C-terminal domain-containing protein [Clostridia bacterium]|nr:MAG: 1-deoxy-D-xylulose-5-phosphate synthase [Firmicutes bacterium ADurb.Bin248]HOG00410.1 transketolase C-terminal domain-containing protein [Clostridia bacterium]HOS17860.1 transketolase C-terminal domain-containing protein [Clostridia bacterium]HPK15798.1 transketolase C-terminal domain-containing protein [Clostridia bacterium]